MKGAGGGYLYPYSWLKSTHSHRERRRSRRCCSPATHSLGNVRDEEETRLRRYSGLAKVRTPHWKDSRFCPSSMKFLFILWLFNLSIGFHVTLVLLDLLLLDKTQSGLSFLASWSQEDTQATVTSMDGWQKETRRIREVALNKRMNYLLPPVVMTTEVVNSGALAKHSLAPISSSGWSCCC